LLNRRYFDTDILILSYKYAIRHNDISVVLGILRSHENSVVVYLTKEGGSDNKSKGKVSQNTTALLDVNETTCFGLLGHHHVCKVLRD